MSPSTAVLDRRRKLPIYAREGVSHVWLIDPKLQLLELYRLDGESYRALAGHAADERIRAEPFDAIELELGALWDVEQRREMVYLQYRAEVQASRRASQPVTLSA